jgi:hypothetical protein
MTYYYDSEARRLIAVNEETNDVRVLEPLNFEDEEEAPKRGLKFDVRPPNVKSGKGCPECGSPSRHKADCSRPAKTERKPMKRVPCAECGSKGSTHRKACAKRGQTQSLTGNDAWAALDEQEKKRIDNDADGIWARMPTGSSDPDGPPYRRFDLTLPLGIPTQVVVPSVPRAAVLQGTALTVFVETPSAAILSKPASDREISGPPTSGAAPTVGGIIAGGGAVAAGGDPTPIAPGVCCANAAADTSASAAATERVIIRIEASF